MKPMMMMRMMMKRMKTILLRMPFLIETLLRLNTESDGEDETDSDEEADLDIGDINHPDYMPPHVQARLLGP